MSLICMLVARRFHAENLAAQNIWKHRFKINANFFCILQNRLEFIGNITHVRSKWMFVECIASSIECNVSGRFSESILSTININTSCPNYLFILHIRTLEVDKAKTGPKNPKISFRLFLSFMLKGFLVRQRCHKQVYLHNLIDVSFTSKWLGTA